MLSGRVAMRWALAVTVCLMAGLAWAVIVVQQGALRIQDESGQPLPKATVTIDFGGTTLEAETDDDGEVALLLLPSGQSAGEDDDDSGFVLVGDGPGRIYYPGGPVDGVPFTVRGGALVLEAPSGGGPSRALLIGGGALVVGGIAVAAGGGDDGTAPPVTSPGGGVMPTPTPTPTPEPEPTPTPEPDMGRLGDWNATCNLGPNAGNHPNLIPGMVWMRIEGMPALVAQDAPVRVTGDDPDFIPVEGILEDAGRLVANGGGTYAGFATSATLEITFNGNASFSGVYTIGGDGGLPGGMPISWNVTGSR